MCARRRVMKAMFEKLAHASIMRLNPASMDKLYDLMTMAVKHQVRGLVSSDPLFMGFLSSGADAVENLSFVFAC